MKNKRKQILDFAATADEKALDRLILVIEEIESPIIGYTHTGEPILKQEIVRLKEREKGLLPQAEFDKRMSILNRKKKLTIQPVL